MTLPRDVSMIESYACIRKPSYHEILSFVQVMVHGTGVIEQREDSSFDYAFSEPYRKKVPIVPTGVSGAMNSARETTNVVSPVEVTAYSST